MSTAMQDAMELAGVKQPTVVGVNVINEHAMSLIRALTRQKGELATRVLLDDGTITVEFYEKDGTAVPHSIVLDRRGTWHVKTFVGI